MMNQQILSPRETCTQHEHYSTWLLGIFFFLSRRTDYKHNYLVQCQIRSQILVIRLCDYRHLKNKVCRSVKHTCWWGHYLGVRYNLNHQKFLSVCSRFVTFQNSFFFSPHTFRLSFKCECRTFYQWVSQACLELLVLT